ncbi:pH-response regulator protein palH/rim21 [Acarospora aff. strigata]|nr:pH-response regulator protein palH/rim21 [Acarospora aff. strigata]
MVLDNGLERRQFRATSTTTTSSVARHCTPFTLPSHGVLAIDDSSTISLTQNAVFKPECTGNAGWEDGLLPSAGHPTTITDLRDPFYASTLPQIYAIGGATVLSYMLVIMLLITPRTFFIGGPGGGSGFLGRRGLISGASGSTSIIGVGGRPWLQKVAALTVAISLTIASVDTFDVAERQYTIGYMDANALTREVVGGVEIRVVRIISDTFLWLAQAQTLIRLFPRHKEKVIIKWTGFALIVLDTIFSILKTWITRSSQSSPPKIVDALPALSYLFALALSLLYAACVVYYSFIKRRFAFFHPKMRNICLVAILALASILVPVVFFVLDVSKPNVAGWGDYIRWVGAAAASVVVWEWVERIEALERDERKDGILGREIYELDEMLEVTPSEEIHWPGSRRYQGGAGAGSGGRTTGWRSITSQVNRINNIHPSSHGKRHDLGRAVNATERQHGTTIPAVSRPAPSTDAPPHATRAVATTPVSRDNTTSAASTEYVLHYHPVTQPSPAISEDTPMQPESRDGADVIHVAQLETDESPRQTQHTVSNITRKAGTAKSRWQVAQNPFKRRRASPPPEVAGVPVAAPPTASSDTDSVRPRNVKVKLVSFAAGQKGRIRARVKCRDPEAALPITVIPAQPRGRARPTTIPLSASASDTRSNRNVQQSTTGEEDGNLKSEVTERSSRPNEYGESSVQQRVDRYSPNNIDNQTLFQRGNLVISEEQFMRDPSRPSSTVSPFPGVGQSPYPEGCQQLNTADPIQTQDLNNSADMATVPTLATASGEAPKG